MIASEEICRQKDPDHASERDDSKKGLFLLLLLLDRLVLVIAFDRAVCLIGGDGISAVAAMVVFCHIGGHQRGYGEVAI